MKTIGRRVFLKEGFAGALGLAVASGAGLGSLNACSQETEQQLKKAVKAAGSYDVVVAGGGPAGFVAAIAAARQLNSEASPRLNREGNREGARQAGTPDAQTPRKRVALIERYGFLGGMATMGYVAPLSVFAFVDKEKDPPEEK